MTRKPLRARNLQQRHDRILLIAEKHEARIAERLMTAFKALRQHVHENVIMRKAYDPDETRDDRGRWTSTGADMPFMSDVRSPRENIHEVASSNFLHSKVIGSRAMRLDQLNSGVVSSPSENDRVQALAGKLRGDSGYWERPIVDDQGNVVEGQHRVEALHALGLAGDTKVPVSQITDTSRDLPTDQMEQAIRGVGVTHSDHVNQIVSQSAEMIAESGSAQAALDQYEFPPQFKTRFEAALRAAQKFGKADPENTARGVGDQILPREQVRIAVETALQDLEGVASEAATVGLASAAAAAAVASPPVSVLSAALHTALAGYRADLVKQVTDATIDAITDVVQQGLTDGQRFDQIARTVRPLIGLTTQQSSWVDSYAAGLADNDPAVMARAYHDARFDPTIQNAIDSNAPLTGDQIDNMVENYANRALAGRATTIARTETLRAANIGAEAGTQAFLDAQGFDSSAMKRFWLVSLDELVCPICLSIPDANPDGVGMDEDFDSDDGPQYLPPDPHPNCRCTVSYQLDPDALALWRSAQDQAA